MNAKEAREYADKANGCSRIDGVHEHIDQIRKGGGYYMSIVFDEPCKWVIDQLKEEGYYVETIDYNTGSVSSVMCVIQW